MEQSGTVDPVGADAGNQGDGASKQAGAAHAGGHRCVVLVHGIGREQRGSFLTGIGEPLTALIKNSYGQEYRAEITTELSSAGAIGATSTTCIRAGSGPEAETAEVLCLREAWWSERFLRPSVADVLYWTLRALKAQAGSIRRGMAIARSEEVEQQSKKVQPIYLPEDQRVYQSPSPKKSRLSYDWVTGLILWLVFVVGYPFVALLVLVAWALEGILGFLGSNSAAKVAQRVLAVVFVDRVSEVYLYLTTLQIRGSIRGAVQETIAPSFAPDHSGCKGLTIIAHSWGAVVVLDSLLQLGAGYDKERQPPVTFVSVGAGFNRAFEMEPSDPLWADLMHIKELLTSMRWINIWARYDPISSGPLDERLREKLREAGAEVHERRVVLGDDPLSDHTSYWANGPEVQSRFAYEVLRHEPPADEVMDKIVLLASLTSQEKRRRAVGKLAWWRLFFYLSALLPASCYWWGTTSDLLWLVVAEVCVALVAGALSLWAPRGAFLPLTILCAVAFLAAGLCLRGITPHQVGWLGDLWLWALGKLHARPPLTLAALAMLLLIYKTIQRRLYDPDLHEPLLDADNGNRPRPRYARRR